MTGPWGMTWDAVDDQPEKTTIAYLENTELYPGEYAEMYMSYGGSSDVIFLMDSFGSKCVGTPDWKTDDEADGAYGV